MYPSPALAIAMVISSGANLTVLGTDGQVLRKLDGQQAAVFALCDGTRPVQAIASQLAPAGTNAEQVYGALDALYDMGLLAQRAVPPATGVQLAAAAPAGDAGDEEIDLLDMLLPRPGTFALDTTSLTNAANALFNKGAESDKKRLEQAAKKQQERKKKQSQEEDLKIRQK